MTTRVNLLPILQTIKLTKIFRGLSALQDVSLELNEGEILGLIGPNGAGKTTLFNCLTGYLSPSSGDIFFQGHAIGHMRPPAIARLGIVRTFQNIRLFGALTVLDNVRVAQQLQIHFNPLEVLIAISSFQQKERLLTQEAMKHLATFELDQQAHQLANSLPYGTQRRLEIARALATNPRVLLLDEPAAGMNASETDALHQMILEVKKRYDLSIVLVEHDMRLVMSLCHRVVVLNYGKLLANGKPDEIRRNPDVVESYLGKTRESNKKPV
jgi:branched-chain amino acid transport system ATP-binding protein